MGKKVEQINIEVQSDQFVHLFNNKNINEFRQAVIHVNPGESKEEAWARHLFDNPLDSTAIVKIFIISVNRKPVV